MVHAVSQVGNTQSCEQDELSQGKENTKHLMCRTTPAQYTVLSNNDRTAPRCVRQTYTSHTVLTKNNTRVDSTGKDSGVTKP